MAGSPFILLPSDPQPLFDRACSSVSEAAVHAIAWCDYVIDAEPTLAALQEILRSRRAPSPLEMVPSEVLELTRWHAPLDGIDGVHAQVFACATLLLSACNAGNAGRFFAEPPGDTLGTLVGLLRHLGGDWLSLGIGFIAFYGRTIKGVQGDGAHEAFAALALLILLADERSPRPGIAHWRALVAHATTEDRRLRDPTCEASVWVVDEEFVLGLTNYDQRHVTWRSHVHERFDEPPTHVPDTVRDELLRIATRTGRP